jgi:hypothetical protein
VGVGVGLFLAMVTLAFLVVRDRWGFRRRLRAGRRAAAALERPREEPIIVAAPVVQPAAVVAEPEPTESVAAPPEPPVAAPEPELPVAAPVAAAAVLTPRPEVAAKPAPAEVKPVEVAKPAPTPAPEPASAPQAPPRVGIQAAVAAALERRRAERAALLAAGQTPIVSPPRPLPPKAPIRPTTGAGAETVASAVNVEALFEQAFGAGAATPAEKPKDGTNSG